MFKARSGQLWTYADTLDESFDITNGKHLLYNIITDLNLLTVIKVSSPL